MGGSSVFERVRALLSIQTGLPPDEITLDASFIDNLKFDSLDGF